MTQLGNAQVLCGLIERRERHQGVFALELILDGLLFHFRSSRHTVSDSLRREAFLIDMSYGLTDIVEILGHDQGVFRQQRRKGYFVILDLGKLRHDGDLLAKVLRQLIFDLKGSNAVHLIVEEINTVWKLATVRIDIEDASTHGKLSGFVNVILLRKAELPQFVFHINDVHPLAPFDGYASLIEMLLRHHQFAQCSRIGHNIKKRCSSTTSLVGRESSEDFCAQDLVGGITLPVFHSALVRGREEQDVVVADELCEIMIKIASLVGILPYEHHLPMNLWGNSSKQDRACRCLQSAQRDGAEGVVGKRLYEGLCLRGLGIEVKKLLWGQWWLIYNLGIFSEPAIKTQAHDAKESLTEDATTHFAGSLTPIDKHHRHLLDFKSYLISCKLHLDLESITFKANLIKRYRLQDSATVAHKSRSSIVHFESGDDAYILRGKVTHQHTSDGPVDNIHSTHIARSNGQIEALVVSSMIEARKIVGIVAEVGVHLKDVVVFMFQRPFESSDIGCSQSLFSSAFDDEEAVAEFGTHQALYDGGRSVGTTIVDDKDMKALLKSKHGPDDLLYIFLFIISRNNDYGIAGIHFLLIFYIAKLRIFLEKSKKNYIIFVFSRHHRFHIE